MRINQNISAMNTYSRLTSANTAKSGSLAKLSSGLRINRAGDDAAGLAISEKMRGQVGGLKQSVRNAQDGISLIQTAEGALTETHSILNRMRELAVQASTDTNTKEDRAEIQKEIDELSFEITRISTDTEFNTMKLLNGERATKELIFHIGANKDQSMKLNIADMGAKALNVEQVLDTDRAEVLEVEGVASKGQVGNVKIEGADGKSYSVEVVQGAAATASTATDQGVAIDDDGKITVTLGTKWDGTASENLKMTELKLVELINKLEGGNFSASIADGEDGTAEVAVAAAIDIEDGTEAVEGVDFKAAGTYGIDVSSQAAANDAIETIDNAINKVSAERSKLGATQNRLEHTINNLTATAENLSEAESRIRDVDMAEEMMQFTKNNILSQAATAMLAQANQMPTSVLQLLQ